MIRQRSTEFFHHIQDDSTKIYSPSKPEEQSPVSELIFETTVSTANYSAMLNSNPFTTVDIDWLACYHRHQGLLPK